METYVWLFPVLFIVHDMEEIVGFIPWYLKNRPLLDQKYPRISRTYRDTSTEGFAFAVYEQMIFCIVVCLASILLDKYGLWFGALVGCTFHFIVHIIQALVIKQYIPGLFTSVIGVPAGCFLIRQSMEILNYSSFCAVVYSGAGMICIFINLGFAHMLMKKFTLWQRRHM